jgi:quercetin dioxygenase-like cupin family protein
LFTLSLEEPVLPRVVEEGCGFVVATKGCVMSDVILKRFESPDEVRTFEKGKFELVHLGGMTIGRATYEPGWRWSEHVGKTLGQKECFVEHVGMVVSGCATAAMSNGDVIEMRAGQVFYVPPGHDSWVVGDEPYVSLHFLGASDYASKK